MVKLTKAAKTDPLVIQTARRIVRAVPAKDWVGEINAVQNWVRNNIRYTLDPYDVETLQTPAVTLTEKHGDCDDHAILVAALLNAIGHPARFRAVSVIGDSRLCHVYAETKIGNGWHSVETTEPWTVGHVPEFVNLKGNIIRHV